MKKNHYVVSNGRLQRKDNTLYFIKDEGAKQSLPIEQIGDIHLFGEVDLNTKLLNFFGQHDVAIHVYNYYGYYSGSYYPRKKMTSGFTVVHQSEYYLDHKRRMYLATQFIIAAVHHMLRNLRRYKEKTAVAVQSIQATRQRIPVAKNIQELMGLEGTIRQIYYQSFNSFLDETFIFTKRSKRPPTDPINAMISFGNQLAYTLVLSEIYKTQLDPTVSFLHEPSTKRFSLSLDLAEIFKPLLVDPVIFVLINKRMIREKHFEYFEGEICYLNTDGKKLFIKTWEERLKRTIKHRVLKRKTSYRYLVRLECYKLIKHFLGDEKYRPLKAWW